MSVFKCKMCGGELEINEGMSICKCPYCGTKQTLPKLDNEKKIILYDRANHFRMANDFDKAMEIYQMILNEDNEDAEAYWSIVLCRYGIEYVEDPTTYKRIPTVNRAQLSSIFVDKDYLKSIEYADGYQRDIYESEANAIDKIQKAILEISNKEEPFDIFICYKETDINGQRTTDSVLAQDIYNNLTKEGYRTFFSRITLENKLGTAYEPYIFAALNSAKIMIILGTCSENFNSVWVKNEWSRYLNLVKTDNSKHIIPIYKNMDPYDIPAELSYIQAQDMSKIGFMQDLIYGIKKLIEPDKHQIINTGSLDTHIIETLMQRGNMLIGEEQWDSAKRCFENVLDYGANNALAYIGLLQIEHKIKLFNDLVNSETPLEESKNYQNAITYANTELKDKLEEYNKISIEKITNKKALKKRKRKKLFITFILLALLIISISIGYKISSPYIKTAINYNKAISCIKDKDYENALVYLDKLPTNYKDKEALYNNALDGIQENNYNLGVEAYNKGDYKTTLEYLGKVVQGYKDRDSYYNVAVEKNKKEQAITEDKENYKKACEEENNGKYKNAIIYFDKCNNYEDSKERSNKLKYEYILENKNDRSIIGDVNSDFYKYISELKDDNYEDSKQLYNSLYNTWNFNCYVNDSNESKYSKTNISKYNTAYIHIVSNQGIPGERINLRFIYSHTTEFGEVVDFENVQTISALSSVYSTCEQKSPSAQNKDIYMTVKIYNDDNNKLIDTVNFTFYNG